MAIAEEGHRNIASISKVTAHTEWRDVQGDCLKEHHHLGNHAADDVAKRAVGRHPTVEPAW